MTGHGDQRAGMRPVGRPSLLQTRTSEFRPLCGDAAFDLTVTRLAKWPTLTIYRLWGILVLSDRRAFHTLDLGCADCFLET